MTETAPEQATKKERKWYQKKRFIIPLVLLVLFVIGVSGGSKSTPTTTTAFQATEKDEKVEPTEAPEEVTVVDLQSFITEFDENQLSAEDKYKDKLVELTGYVENISESFGGYYIVLKPTADKLDFSTSTHCGFKDKEPLKAIKNGDQVTVQGRVNTQSFGIIDIDECALK